MRVSHRIDDYKKELMLTMCGSADLVKAIDSQAPLKNADNTEGYDPRYPNTLVWNNIIPALRIIGKTSTNITQKRSDAYILIGCDILNINKYNPTYAKYRVTFRILVHTNRMYVEGRAGTRLDWIYEELKELFDGSQTIGFSEFELERRVEDVYDETFFVCDMTFYTDDLRHPVTKKKER